MPAPEALIERVAQALVERRGFGWYDDPMEGGQDAYDICRDAMEDARTAIGAMQAPLLALIEAQIPLWEETDSPRHALSILWGKVRDLTGGIP